jgi:hypothetical protein
MHVIFWSHAHPNSPRIAVAPPLQIASAWGSSSLTPSTKWAGYCCPSVGVFDVDDVVKGFAVYFAVGSIAQGFKDEEVMKY